MREFTSAGVTLEIKDVDVGAGTGEAAGGTLAIGMIVLLLIGDDMIFFYNQVN